MGTNIIFVCTSNVCRSPMAEGFAKKWLSERHGVNIPDLERHGFSVQSRGISPNFEPPGSCASPHGATIMREHGVKLAGHRSSLLSLLDILEATHIYCMAPGHEEAVLNLYSDAKLKGFRPSSPLTKMNSTPALISTYNPEIPDPWHGTLEYYRACAGMLEKAVVEALQEDLAPAE